MRLKLHIGHGKTGSSYLQSWFACNARLLLEKYGILYPGQHHHAEKGHFSLGNCEELDAFLCNHRVCDWIRQSSCLISERKIKPNSLFFSFEGLTRKFNLYQKKLVDRAELVGIKTIDILLIVRDPLEHACSVYNQMVKRHGYYGSLDEWLDIYDFTDYLLKTIQELNDNKNLWNIRVANYKNISSSLLDFTKSWLNISTIDSFDQIPNFTVNRSLTYDELHLMRIINRKIGIKSRLLGEKLSNQFPNLNSYSPQPSIESAKKFVDKWMAHVTSINHLLPQEAQLGLDISTIQEQPLKSDIIKLSHQQISCLIDSILN